MESLRSKPFWDRSPLESLADGYKKLPRNFKLCMLATFIIGLAAHMYCYTNMLTGADDSCTVYARIFLGGWRFRHALAHQIVLGSAGYHPHAVAAGCGHAGAVRRGGLVRL